MIGKPRAVFPFDALHIEQSLEYKICVEGLKLMVLPPPKGAALRYIGILGGDLVETLEFDPQIYGIKMRV